jgi:hypothetical protein
MHIAVRFIFAIACTGVVIAQQPPTPVTYTYVAEWVVPRAQWQEVNANFEKNRGVLDRRLSDGSIVEWGRAIPLVHTENGPTHITWYASRTLAGINRVLEDVRKLTPDASMLTAKHRDYLYRSMVDHSPTNVPRRSAYMMTSVVNVVPGKGTDWRTLWDKETDPVYQQAMKDGTILAYGLDQEYVHTASPFARYEWVMLPSVESIDKLNDAFRSRSQARSADENRALGLSMRETSDGTSHRDGLWYVLDYVRK